MRYTKKNKICPNCEVKFAGCKCIRTLASDGSSVHRTCKDQYEYKLKNNEKEKRNSRASGR